MRRFLRITRNIFLALIAAIVVLAAVLAFNTFTHGSNSVFVVFPAFRDTADQ